MVKFDLLRLPHARHPQLRPFLERLSMKAGLTADEVGYAIAVVMTQAGLTELDIEMVQPGADARVPFAADASGLDSHQAQITGHVHRLLQGGKR